MFSLSMKAAWVVFLATSVYGCTTILVGNRATEDGSYIVARNSDFSTDDGIYSDKFSEKFIIPEARYEQPEYTDGVYQTKKNLFQYRMPKTSLGYLGLITFPKLPLRGCGSGYNVLGVGLTATESIINNSIVLGADPYNNESGIRADSILEVILPCGKSVREAVMLLGSIIEEHGAASGFGVSFVDKTGIWYLETGSGHQWLAVKLDNDEYFVTANQGRLQDYDPNDTEKYLASPTLVSFAIAQGVYNPDLDGKFNFHKAYSTDDAKINGYYDYPRVYTLQQLYSPGIETHMEKPLEFPVFAIPTQQLSIDDVKQGLRNHYEGTPDDPYTYDKPKRHFRPIAVFRCFQSHVLHFRPALPFALRQVAYVALGMPTLSPFIALYSEGEVPAGVTGTGMIKADPNNSDELSAFWIIRHVQTLALTDFTRYAPMVKAAYDKFEQKQKVLMEETESKYLKIYKDHPKEAKQLLDEFELIVTQLAITTAKNLKKNILINMGNKCV